METLANWIHRRGPLHPRDAVGWAIRLAKHLEALHQHGVAHGNVSPACVLVESNDPRRRGLVADVRRTAEMIQYHSPERFRDGQLTPADDTWGVAATLFTAITAARPYGEVQQEILARLPHGVPALGAYGITDDALQAILSSALSPDPSRRIAHVQHLRQHLERWFNDPSVFDLRPLDDEETGEEDQAATAMLAMDQMFDEPRSSQNDSGLFAPASFPQSGASPRPPGSAPIPSAPGPSSPGVSSQQATERRPAPPAVPPAPLGEQDATVMRELPAHIMALAARAAGGSNPPPPPPPAPDEDSGGATRVGNTADIAAAMQAGREPPAPPVPISQPGGPTSPRPRPPRAIRSTQLGVGMPMAPTPPVAPTPPAGPPGPAPPRPGFAPPPTSLSSAPPPNDPDEVRTMMHPTADALKAMGRTAPNLPPGAPQPPQPPPPPQRPPPPAPPQPPPQAPAPPADALADDDDDGGRTVLREPPSFDEFFRPPDAPNAPPAPQAQWKPAAPPMQPRAFGQGSTDRPPQGGAPGQPGAGVSALIQETLEKGPPQGGPPPGFPPPIEPTSAFPGSQEWAGSQGGGEWQGQPAGGVAGPFAPLGGQSAPVAAGPFAPQGPTPGPFGPQPFGPGIGAPPMHGGGPSDPMLQPGMDGMAQPPPMDMGFGPPPGGPMGEMQQAPPGGYPVGAGLGGQVEPQPKKKGSKLGLLVVCFLVLILAAALTFIFLRYRHTLTFLPPELRGAPPQ